MSELVAIKGIPDRVFDGVDYDQFLQLAGHIEFAAIYNPDKFDSDRKKCAYAAAHFRGAAMTWVLGRAPFVEGSTVLDNWGNFQALVMSSCCGLTTDDHLREQRQRNLEALRVTHDDVPTFFAEFERLTANMGTTSDVSRLALLRPKLPAYYLEALATNGQVFDRYQRVKTFCINVWTLRPSRTRTNPGTERATLKCAKCGKKGHDAVACRSKN